MAKRSKKKKARSGEFATKVAGRDAVRRRPPFRFNRDWLLGLGLVVAVILTYQPMGQAGFIWDDRTVVTTNPCIVGPLGLKEIWTTSAADICPLTLSTFWLEHTLWGLAPLPYHLVNVLLHAACAVVLWLVLRSLRVRGAWLGAALWALHPVQVESVAWITEMKNTESGLFFLLSILFFVKWLRARDPDGQSEGGWNYGLSLLFAALAMASKSSTVVLPVVLCLCAWWVEGRWLWRNLVKIGPIFLMSIAAGVVSIWTQRLQFATAPDSEWVRTWPERLTMAGDAVWFYLGKLAWPHPLITVYPRWKVDASQWVSYLPLLAVIIVLFILWLKRESWARPWFFVFAYFLVTLLPILGLVDNTYFRYSLVANHFQYLASMGPLALASAGMVRRADFAIPRWPWLQGALAAGVLLILGILSWQQTWIYQSEETLWTDTLAQNPDCWLGRNNLGDALLQKGQVDAAIAQFQKVLEIHPNNADTYYNLGHALTVEGEMDEAIVQYQKALEINPNYVIAHYNLGNIFARKGQMDEAIAQYQKALEIDPNDVDALMNLGNALCQKGQVDDAIAQFQKVLEIAPDFITAHYDLGAAFLQKRQVNEAIVQFQKALKIDPTYALAHNELGMAFLQEGQVDTAIAQFQEALRLKPDFTAAQDNLNRVQAFLKANPGRN